MPTRRYQFITLAEGRQLRSTKEKIFLPNAQINYIGLRQGCEERFASKVHFQVILNFNSAFFKSQTSLLSSVLSLLLGFLRED